MMGPTAGRAATPAPGGAFGGPGGLRHRSVQSEPAGRLALEHWGRTDWEAARTRQLELVVRRLTGRVADTLVLTEHPPVYTVGRAGRQAAGGDIAGIPVRRAERGGGLTYHGPGQLVGYPIVHLDHFGRDVHAFLGGLEAAVCAAVCRLGLEAYTVPGLTGVWAGGCKICSIGIAVRRWVSFHGLALNVHGDLEPFARIAPCGLDGVRMASLESLGLSVSLELVAEAVGHAFDALLAEAPFAGRATITRSAVS